MQLKEIVVTYFGGAQSKFKQPNPAQGEEVVVVLPKGNFGSNVRATFVKEPGDTKQTLEEATNMLHAIGL